MYSVQAVRLMRPARCLVAVLLVAALLDPGAAQAGKSANKDWAGFLSKATAYLRHHQDAAEREFALESWERFDLDPATGTFTFSTKGKPGVVAHALIVGSIAGRPHTWKWSWSDLSMPGSLTVPMLRVRKFGKNHGFKKLTHSRWPGDQTDGWKMAAAAAYILSAKGAYRAPYGDGAVFLIFTDIRRVR